MIDWLLQLVFMLKPYIPLMAGIGGSLIMIGVLGGRLAR